jgi:hypothetical protein
VIENAPEKITHKVLFEIGRSCAPSVIATVSKLITSLRIVNQAPNEESKLTFFPVNLEPELKFKIIPHLLRPGTMFTPRMSFLLATIAKVSNSIFSEDAEKVLVTNKGKWIDFSMPANVSTDFARLMLKVSDFALTDDEEKQLRAIVMIGSLRKKKSQEIDVEIAYSSYKDKRLDYKEQCVKCHQWRSLTLLLDDGCVFCTCPDKIEYLESDETSSWMCECRRCLVHYAVYDVENLKFRRMPRM